MKRGTQILFLNINETEPFIIYNVSIVIFGFNLEILFHKKAKFQALNKISHRKQVFNIKTSFYIKKKKNLNYKNEDVKFINGTYQFKLRIYS